MKELMTADAARAKYAEQNGEVDVADWNKTVEHIEHAIKTGKEQYYLMDARTNTCKKLQALGYGVFKTISYDGLPSQTRVSW